VRQYPWTVTRVLPGVLFAAAAGAVVAAADLQPRAERAWSEYVAHVEQAFVESQDGLILSLRRVDVPPPPGLRARRGDAEDAEDAAARLDTRPIAGPANGDGIMTVPGGLVHHWKGRVFIPGATLQDALDVSRAYATYPEMYRSVLSATVLEQDDNVYVVLMRVHEDTNGVSAVLDIRSHIEYHQRDAHHAYSISHSEEIRQVEHAGSRDERRLPAGHDSGYLWRTATFTSFAEQHGGVSVEMETLGLSRGWPKLLGWLIEPIARRLGRKSVEGSLREFERATTRAVTPAPADP
jgi:hypothetical protein